MTDYLSHVYLYKDIGITRDYSVVHDMDKSIWKSRLHSGTSHRVWDGDVNYYRLGDRIRIEAPFELVRNATYGLLEIIDVKIGTGRYVEQYFFWVDDVRLLKNNSAPDPTSLIGGDDVVELTVSEDIWSNYNGKFTLKDSYVERRHMPRWNGNVPIYYPDAAQGVTGAYRQESTQDLTGSIPYPSGSTTVNVNPFYIIVTALKPTGELKFYVSACFRSQSGINLTFKSKHWNKDYFSMTSLMDGTFYTATGLSAENIQSITVTPYLADFASRFVDGKLDLENNVFFSEEVINGADGFSVVAIIPNFTFSAPGSEGVLSPSSKNVTIIKPVKTSTSNYDVINEPMMFHTPARIRKIVTGMGGTIADVPDIDAFQETFTLQNIIDVASVALCVYGGSDIKSANAIGNLGMTETPTLPIFNSAWMSYKAINKAGDDIAFNAKQTMTLINGVAGVGTAAATAAIPGIGAAVGVLSGSSSAMSAASSYYLNEKEMEAKRTTIRNSPCTVTSTGSGMTAYGQGFFDVFYMTLKIDDVSFAKLEEQYYFYGYFVNKTMRGTVDLHTRKLFDFIKTSGARVTGSCPADVLRSIGAIFDKGVTIYHGTDGYAKIGTGMTYSNDEYSSTSAGAENQ